MGFQPKIAIAQSNSSGILIYDNTGNYDATNNPTGYGAPNPLKASITAILLQQVALGNALPAATAFSSQQRTNYLSGIGVPTTSVTLTDGVYDVRALIGYAGPSPLSAAGSTPQFTLSNASTVFQVAVGFTIDSIDPAHLYRIDRTKPLTVSGGYVTENLPVATNLSITIYYEAQAYALVYDQGEACLLADIAKYDLDCDCDNDDTVKLLERYARYLSMLNRFNVTKDYSGANKLAIQLQSDCNGTCLPCGDSLPSSTATATPAGIGPAIISQPQAVTINAGQNATFQVIASGTPTLKYQWMKNGVAISGATSSTYTILNAQNADAANYSVVITNDYGTIVSNTAALTITAAVIPVTIVLQPVSQTVAPGSNVSFTIAATGSATITYQWRKNGVNIGGATGTTLSLNAVSGPDVANYDCVVTNPAGSVTSSVASLALGVVALWGWRDTVPTVLADITGLQDSGAFVTGGTITADFRANNVPKYLVMAEPSSEPAKTKWYADATNYGDIGDPNIDLFGVPVIIGSYRVYVTVYQTYNTQSPIQFKVS